MEALIASVVLSVALLGHAASTLTHHSLSRDQQSRSDALQTVRQFVERLRADEDWPGLYARLRTLRTQASLAGTGTRLANGLRAYPPSTYFPDFTMPAQPLAVLVDVPISATGVLQEDLLEAHFGLPADLNGDARVDALPRDADYRALPVRVLFQWRPTGQGTRELTVVTWLRGDR